MEVKTPAISQLPVYDQSIILYSENWHGDNYYINIGYQSHFFFLI